MKVFNSKLAAIGLAAFVFASCSDSTDTPNSGNGNSVVDVTTIGLTSSTPTGVFNYKTVQPTPVSSSVQELQVM